MQPTHARVVGQSAAIMLDGQISVCGGVDDGTHERVFLPGIQ